MSATTNPGGATHVGIKKMVRHLLSCHPPPERWLSRKMTALGHGDCSNHDPHQGAEYEGIDEQGPPWRYRREDHCAGCETRVHKHRQEQALTSTVVDPHHQHP